MVTLGERLAYPRTSIKTCHGHLVLGLSVSTIITRIAFKLFTNKLTKIHSSSYSSTH